MPVSIYLDQLHWIHLAQAHTNHKNGEAYKKVYQHLLEQREVGKIVCPLSLTNYMELSATSNYRQRTDVATVMAKLSGFRTIASTSVLRRAEIEQALHKRFGKPEVPVQPQPFGLGVFYAANDENRMMKLHGNVSSMESFSTAVGGIEKIKELELKYSVQAEFEMLRGSHESQLQELRDKYGYAPEAAEEVARKRAAQEEELAQQMIADPSIKRKLDNIVTARYLYWELIDPLLPALAKVGMTIHDFLDIGGEGITQFVHDIPTADILVAFTKANLKNLNRTWKKNDIHDMDALAVSIPYCDVVVTEKHAHAQMVNAGMEQKYGTKLLRNIEDLLDVI
jgi:hypothetical protein